MYLIASISSGDGGQNAWPLWRSNATMRHHIKAIAVCVGIGQCEDVCSHGQLPWETLQAGKFLPQQEINKREFQQRH